MLRIVLGIILSACFVIVWGNEKAVQWYINWNVHNFPYVIALYLYPLLKNGYRILRFYLYA
jgi:hypothetical protein